MSMNDSIDRSALAQATQRHVPFDGWTLRALRAGAADLGCDPERAVLAFPGGAIELIEECSSAADRAVLKKLAGRNLAAMRVRDKVALGVRLRLEGEAAHREAVRRAAARLAFPGNQPLAARLLWATADAVWRGIGDRSADWNFYSKRTLLSGVYAATLLHWLQDDSEEFADSWAFLDRRIAGLITVAKGPQIPPLASSLGSAFAGIGTFLRSRRST